jgi:hypothetical protein
MSGGWATSRRDLTVTGSCLASISIRIPFDVTARPGHAWPGCGLAQRAVGRRLGRRTLMRSTYITVRSREWPVECGSSDRLSVGLLMLKGRKLALPALKGIPSLLSASKSARRNAPAATSVNDPLHPLVLYRSLSSRICQSKPAVAHGSNYRAEAAVTFKNNPQEASTSQSKCSIVTGAAMLLSCAAGPVHDLLPICVWPFRRARRAAMGRKQSLIPIRQGRLTGIRGEIRSWAPRFEVICSDFVP